jgi:hypothetical protein
VVAARPRRSGSPNCASTAWAAGSPARTPWWGWT